MDLFTILSSKPHNVHYLKRYVKFINLCETKNKTLSDTYTEKHHICPRSKSLFPEFSNLTKNKWNKIILTAKQHFVAHHLLWKAYPNTPMAYVFKFFVDGCKTNVQNRFGGRVTSKIYQSLKNDMVTVMRNTVGVKDTITGKSYRMPTEEYYSSNRAKHIVATTTGYVTVRDTSTNETFNISKSDYESRPDNIVSTSKGYMTAKNSITGETFRITVEEFNCVDKPNFIVSHNKGNTISKESRVKMSKPRSEEGKKNIKAGMKPKTPKQKQDMSERRKLANKINRVCCIKTRKEYDLVNFNRWCV